MDIQLMALAGSVVFNACFVPCTLDLALPAFSLPTIHLIGSKLLCVDLSLIINPLANRESLHKAANQS
jgi:hypothetical protein